MQAVLRNDFLTLTVDTHGAEAVSLKNDAGEEVLWQADPEVWPRHAPILFPWTGELPGSSYSHKGKTYHVVKQGFARDVEHTLVRADENEIVLELRSSPELKATQFPFDFILRSTFRLENRTVCHTLTVENPGSEELRFGIGFHPAFNIPFDRHHTTEDYEFRFDRPESPVILDARPHGLLSGKCYYKWKNAEKIQLTDDLFSNDSFCMAGLRTRTLGIYEKDSGRHIVCNVEDFPYKLIWSALAKPVRFVCIEPWHSLPSAETDPQEWSERAAAVCLAPGKLVYDPFHHRHAVKTSSSFQAPAAQRAGNAKSPMPHRKGGRGTFCFGRCGPGRLFCFSFGQKTGALQSRAQG